MTDFRTTTRRLLTAIALSSLCIGSAVAADKEIPETTPEGLTLVTNEKSRIVYAAEDFNPSDYTKVMILDGEVAFAKNWQRDYNRDAMGLDGRVKDSDVARMKSKLAAELKTVFTETMTANGHEVVTEAAADVIILRPAIINVVANAPDVRAGGISRTYVADAGEMTLYLELYDSVSGSLLAQIIDQQRAKKTAPTVGYSSSMANLNAVDRILKDWANELAGHFGEMSSPAQ
ncbi:MAG: DUF3313 family protein [Woeseiaceae bacterium]